MPLKMGTATRFTFVLEIDKSETESKFHHCSDLFVTSVLSIYIIINYSEQAFWKTRFVHNIHSDSFLRRSEMKQYISRCIDTLKRLKELNQISIEREKR